MNRGRRGRWPQKAGSRPRCFDRPSWHQSCGRRERVTTLAFAGNWQVRIQPRLVRVGHDNNAADTIKGTALHVRSMAGITATGDARMTHLAAGKRYEASNHRSLMATVTPELSDIGQMIARRPFGSKVIVARRTGER